MSAALLPCPFCGAAATIASVARDWFRLEADHRDDCMLGGKEFDVPQTAEQLACLVRDWNTRAVAPALPIDFKQATDQGGWQPIATAPKGAKGVTWMLLAWGPEEDQKTGYGMRIHDKFYAAAVFFCLGQEKSFELREVEVQPTHWCPRPTAPTLQGVADGDAA